MDQSANQQNRHRINKRNKSGYTGVSVAQRGTWMAAIFVDKRQIFLGYHKTPEQAHQAYLEGKRKYRRA